MTELNLFKEFAICSINELREEEIRMAKTTSFCHSEKASRQGLSVYERNPLHCLMPLMDRRIVIAA